jgi:hypothetical protein
MKKILLAVCVLLSTFVAYAGPLEELTAIFERVKNTPSEREQIQSASQTVVRGYLSSNSGLISQSSVTQYIGYLAPRSTVLAAISQLGYTFISSQHRMEIYRAPAASANYGFVLLVYYDTRGYASELYLLDDAL